MGELRKFMLIAVLMVVVGCGSSKSVRVERLYDRIGPAQLEWKMGGENADNIIIEKYHKR